MPMQPYLFFTNTCREAMTRYQEILGGELSVMTVADMPEGEEPPPGEPNPDLVIHAALSLDDGSLLMASDDPTGDATGVVGMAISLDFDREDRTREVFDALAEDGEVGMPLEATFWAPLFGMCTDRFGVQWMIAVEGEPPAS